jgi:hypothetical protein
MRKIFEKELRRSESKEAETNFKETQEAVFFETGLI